MEPPGFLDGSGTITGGGVRHEIYPKSGDSLLLAGRMVCSWPHRGEFAGSGGTGGGIHSAWPPPSFFCVLEDGVVFAGTYCKRIPCGFLAGMLLGGAAYRFPFFRELISPVISLMKAVPVASFVILALIFMGSKNLALLIVFLLVIPIVYYNTLSGFQSTDRDLLEMAQVFRIPAGKRLTGIYRPALRPFLVSAAQTSIGMSWKSGVAAEVIGVSAGSIGEQLYLSKIYLETADLFAWTIMIIVLSMLCEKAFTGILKML